jgi:hypothetical protein
MPRRGRAARRSPSASLSPVFGRGPTQTSDRSTELTRVCDRDVHWAAAVAPVMHDQHMNVSLGSLCRRLRSRRPPSASPAVPRRWHSVSSTREYEGCPRRYRFGYLDKRPQDRPVPTTWRFGSVVHEGLEAAYRLAMDRPDVARLDRVAATTAAVHASWDRYALGDDQHGRQRAVWHLTRALTKDVLHLERGRILGVEMAFRGRFSERDRLAGFADLVLERPDGTVELVDHKVTRHRSTPEQLREDFQLNLYGELARRRWPAAPRFVATHHYPTGPAAVSVELDPARMTAAYERVRATAAVIEQDRVFPPTPSDRCGHCPWLPSCAEGSAYIRGGVTRSSTPRATWTPSWSDTRQPPGAASGVQLFGRVLDILRLRLRIQRCVALDRPTFVRPGDQLGPACEHLVRGPVGVPCDPLLLEQR